MTLQEITTSDILYNFTTIQDFNDQMNHAMTFCVPCEKITLLNIKLYYNILFEHEVDLESDIIQMKEMALHCLDSLNRQYDRNKLFIF